ncbi:MAG: MCE family protein [Candidatus Lindowbacteria bacterium]|nr:MCE family protein [Candidatus Lindowbacteria bacterium]
MSEYDKNLAEVHRFLGIRPGRRQRRIGWVLIVFSIFALSVAMIRGQDFGRKVAGMMIYATLDRGYKLEPGSPVLLADVHVGEVDEISVEHVPFRIELSMRIYPKFVNSIPEGTVVGVELENIFERVVVLYPPAVDTGITPNMLEKNARLDSKKTEDLMAEAHSMIEAVGQELSGALAEVHAFTNTLNDTNGDFQIFMANMREGSENFMQVTAKLDEKFSDKTSVAGVVLNDDYSAENIKEVISNMKVASANAKKITSHLEEASSELPKLVKDADKTVNKMGELADQAGGSWIFGGKSSEERGKTW